MGKNKHLTLKVEVLKTWLDYMKSGENKKKAPYRSADKYTEKKVEAEKPTV